MLAGLGVGGLWGFREGAFRPLAVSNTRLRINSILNSVTRRGTFIGNSAGVLGGRIAAFTTFLHPAFTDYQNRYPPPKALTYNGINSSLDAWRGKHDAWGSMAAGGMTGALFKSTGACWHSYRFIPISSTSLPASCGRRVSDVGQLY